MQEPAVKAGIPNTYVSFTPARKECMFMHSLLREKTIFTRQKSVNHVLLIRSAIYKDSRKEGKDLCFPCVCRIKHRTD